VQNAPMLRKLWLFFGLALFLLLPSAEGTADQPAHPFSAADLMALCRISDPQVSPDGKWAVFSVSLPRPDTNTTDHFLYLGSLQERNFQPVTTSGQKATHPRFSPDGRHLYFLAPSSGTQQIWSLSIADRKMEVVTAFPTDIESFGVAPHGRTLILSTAVIPGKTPAQTTALLQERKEKTGNARIYDRLPVRQWDQWRDGTRHHLFSYHLADGAIRDLMGTMDADCPARPFGSAEDFSISPDGLSVAFSARDEGQKEAWSTNYDLFLVPADGSAPPQRITANPAADIQPRFSPDGKTLAYLAASRPGNEADRFRIVLRDLATGKEKHFDLRADETPAGDRSPDSLVWSLDGKRLFATADHLGQHALFVLNIQTGQPSLFMKTGTVAFPRPLPDGAVLFGWSSLQRPLELYLAYPDGGENRRISRLNDDILTPLRLGRSAAFRFQGAGDRTIHGRVIFPAVFDSARKYPVAFLIHGGPQTSNLNEFSYRWNPQVFAGAGYAVVAIDFPGSTGYGQAYTDAINGDWGGAPAEDLLTGLHAALAQYPFLDRERIGALGPSFGGYMVQWLAGHKHPFRCFISHAGIFDRERFFYQTDELWFAEWEGGGLPWQNPQGHKRHNPSDLVKKWQTPTLLIHGEKDFRVPYTQGLSAFTALQRKGIPSKLLIFPDEGHWILQPHNALLWYRTVLSWLDQWLTP